MGLRGSRSHLGHRGAEGGWRRRLVPGGARWRTGGGGALVASGLRSSMAFACEPERGRPSPGTAENVAGRAARAIIQPVWPRSLPPNRLHETGLNDAEFLSLGL